MTDEEARMTAKWVNDITDTRLDDLIDKVQEAWNDDIIEIEDKIDLQQLILSEQRKRSVRSEDVQRAIDDVQYSLSCSERCGTKCEVIVGQNSARLAITALEAYQPWISVDDRLPKDYQHENGEPMEFNVMIKDAEVPTTLCFNGSKWFEWSDTDRFFEVTHWMPLPQPPKGEANG